MNLWRKQFAGYLLVTGVLLGCTTTVLGQSFAASGSMTSRSEPDAPAMARVVSTADSEGSQSDVIVEASGATLRDARDDAVRAALLSTVEQLVIADRLVDNGDLVRDEVLTTQNGFISGFEVLERGRTEFGEVEITARVRVSEETILNYVALDGGGATDVEGAALFAEVSRRSEQQRTLNRMLDRLAVGYPWDVLKLELTDLRPLTGNPDLVHATIKVETDENFMNALERFSNRVSILSYPTSIDIHRVELPPWVEGSISKSSEVDPAWRKQESDRRLRGPDEYSSTQYCFAYSQPRPMGDGYYRYVDGFMTSQGINEGRCYLYPPGEFIPEALDQLKSRVVDPEHIGLLLAFVDTSGRPRLSEFPPAAIECDQWNMDCREMQENEPARTHGCLLFRGKSYGGFPEAGVYMIPIDHGAEHIEIPFDIRGAFDGYPASVIFAGGSRNFEVVMRATHVDFSEVTAFRGRVVLLGDSPDISMARKWPGEAPVDTQSLCRELLSE